MLSALTGLAAVLALTVATGYFVAQEFSFVTADRSRLDADARRGDTRARRALAVMGRLSFMLSGAQLGITITALVVGFIAEPATAAVIEPVLDALGVPGTAVGPVALALGFVLATVVQMVLGELLPKNLALARAEPLAKALAASTLVYLAVAGPVIRLFDTAATRLLRLVGVEPVEELSHGATLTELGDIIGESHRSGRIPDDLSVLLERALTFGERTAAEVMVPRPDVIAVPAGATVARLKERIAETGYTNYPVYDQDIDDVIGIAGVREIAPPGTADDRLVADLVRPALLLPATVPLHLVLGRMRDAREEFAAVVDEYGGLAGILTFEDIAEQLVGQIADENDALAPTPAPAAGGVWRLPATLRIAQVRDVTGLALPDDPAYDSLSGLFMAHLGRLPRIGDRVEVAVEPRHGPPARAELEVLSVRRRVPRTIAMRLLSTAREESR
ncbi:hemolysin family protein [Actinoallomurus sp. NBC_01490]|uniref:hemolysin family protein n=1 Tax=Actinoallomurus sp. NBC_01490 TaxID=2903557 RepID=UPI002E33EE60|nr:hemolysin family protein [Actinoallomurus sp. NBC_01490]